MIETAGRVESAVSVDRETRDESARDPKQTLALARDAARAVEDAWLGEQEPDLRRVWKKYDPEGLPRVLVALIKADLHCRRLRGLSIAVADYLTRFPQLQSFDDCVVSLVYEEYCLREEEGEELDPEEFCGRYEPWRDSLLSQLRYHRMLSEAIGSTGDPSMSRSSPRRPTKLPRIGERFEGFRLDKLLGEGGAARVFLARDEELERFVALKISADRGREPSIMGRLDHLRIVPILSVSRAPATGLRGLCMPWQPGLSLDKVVARIDPEKNRPRRARVFRELIETIESPPAPTDKPGANSPGSRSDGWRNFPDAGSYFDGVAWIVARIADALAHAHGKKILHRDVKPANILLTARDGPQLLDFNLADEPEDVERAKSSLRGGTPPYMAPEQLAAFFDEQRWSDVRPTADLYALGLVLRELLTGKRPPLPEISPNSGREEFARRVAHRDPPKSPRSIDRHIPHALDAIARQCLATDPKARYQSAEALAEDLDRFLQRRPLRNVVNPSRLERARYWLTRRRGFVAAVLVVAALCAALASTSSRAAFHRLAVEVRLARLRRAVDSSPDSAAPRIDLASALETTGSAEDADAAVRAAAERPDAVERFREAVARTPNVPSLWTGLGNAAFKKGRGRWSEAADAYESALRLDPNRLQALNNLASIAFHSRHDDRLAHSLASRALRVAESNHNLADRAVWLVDLRRRRASYSIHWGESLLGSRNPSFNEAKKLLEQALDDLNATRTHWNDFDSATKRTTEHLAAKSHFLLGRLFTQLHRDDDARNAFNLARNEIVEAAQMMPGHEEDDKLKNAIDANRATLKK